MDSTKDYQDSLAAIDQHATMFTNHKGGNRRNISTSTQDDSTEEDPKADKEKKKRDKIEKKLDKKKERECKIHSLTKEGKIKFDSSIWEQLPGEVKKFVAEHNKGKNKKSDTQTQTTGDDENGDNRTTNNVSTRQVQEDDDESEKEKENTILMLHPPHCNTTSNRKECSGS